MPYRVYVIRLKPGVLKKRRFARENPGYIQGKPCVYVGSTHLTPEQRYARHIDPSSTKGNRYVREFHDGLSKRLNARQPPCATREEAERREKQLAERLRRKGYAVWQR